MWSKGPPQPPLVGIYINRTFWKNVWYNLNILKVCMSFCLTILFLNLKPIEILISVKRVYIRVRQ